MEKIESEEISVFGIDRQESSIVVIERGKAKISKQIIAYIYTKLSSQNIHYSIKRWSNEKMMNRIALSSEFGDLSLQSLSWKQIEEVSIKDTALTISKEISAGIYQWY